ncbi:protein of unknown function DUF1616 [Methanobacterium lacus]|uniref:DUF1616 domain-containing protein n=1 Tax=Methanobacterium lacus (strain AL-21) TaxID=877455 RepID=F0TBL7_METLA|nr:DUF1616 domain-containing protein [Methanobacterium lacus]ADZ09094.1 protein of unknown function DUF1616 [Methanobacterium lacus]
MINKLKYLDLILIFITTIACLSVIMNPTLTNYIFRIILIIMLILFLSGYSLIAVIYPRQNDLDLLERLALSFGFPLIGIAIVIVLTNLIPLSYFNFLKSNINMIIGALGLLTIVLIFIAIIRRKKAIQENKYIYSRVYEVKNAIKPDLYEKSGSKNEKELISRNKEHKVIKNEIDDKSNLETKKRKNIYPKFVSKDLLLILLTSVLTIIFIVTPKLNETFVRTFLGILLILFIPGYSLIAALFPKKGDLDGIERSALSFGLSIAITPIIGLMLNYTPWGIRLTPILISLSAFTLIMLLIAFIRRRRVPEGQKFYVNFGGTLSSIKNSFSGESKTGKFLSIILIITILMAISTTVFIILKPKQGESFTEFYILGPNGKASDYPTNLTLGQNGTVIIGIVNHEYQTANYELVVSSNGTVMSQQNITLTNGNQTQIPYSFTAGSAGYKNIEFLLYKLPDTTNVYRSLHLYVNMT